MRNLNAKRRQAGQGMTEYIIIVALIAIAAIGVFTAFGKTIRGQMGVMTAELAGNASGGSRTAANKGSTDANDQAQKNKGMKDFEDGNQGK